MAKKRNISLPWEQRGKLLGRLALGSRLRAAFFVMVLLAVVFGLYRSADSRAKVRDTRIAIATVRRAIDRFRADNGRCPRSTTELVHPPRTGARYLRRAPRDGWGRELWVLCPAHDDPDGAEVLSAGPSGSFHEDDNIQ